MPFDARTVRFPLVLLLLGLFVLAVAGCADAQPVEPSPSAAPPPSGSPAGVLAAVGRAPGIRAVPADLTPALSAAGDDLGFDPRKCEAAPAADRLDDPCVFGDPAGAKRVVLYVLVYRNQFHLTGTYARVLNEVLEDALLDDGTP
ncbi:hypothetical protein [Paractinoplanes durhamensis]|uniref:DUF3558 domain-containing protein n=1 Tax=Paractinoplanes durhamensis TaxID=113563 RepID=A0ABQ3Z804_9ACTN|nr:hypothetical protein [Actinoplanes durhamensis]GIE05972.1 hypothetical protein Adu01nite_73220 [Actinoplanes durhamensis]